MTEKSISNFKQDKVEKSKASESSHDAQKLKDTKKTNKPGNIIAIIRIKGCVKLRENFENTLDRLRLKRKYACVLINSSDRNLMGMLKKIRNYVAYGEINDETLAHLIKERGKSIDGNKKEVNINAEEVAKGLMSGKKLSDFGLKNFFRLHPPRGGINSKLQYPKGVLGNHRENINKLVERMM